MCVCGMVWCGVAWYGDVTATSWQTHSVPTPPAPTHPSDPVVCPHTLRLTHLERASAPTVRPSVLPLMS